MGGTQDQGDRSPQAARRLRGTHRCHSCGSTSFEPGHDGGLTCVDCGVQLRGFVEEQADAGVADGAQLRYRVHSAGGPSTLAAATVQPEAALPTVRLAFEAFQALLLALLRPLEERIGAAASSRGGADGALRASAHSLWRHTARLFSARPLDEEVTSRRGLPKAAVGGGQIVLSAQLALAVLLLACEEGASAAGVSAAHLVEWCRAGQLPLLSFALTAPSAYLPLVRWLPGLLRPYGSGSSGSSFPTADSLALLATRLRKALHLRAPPVRLQALLESLPCTLTRLPSTRPSPTPQVLLGRLAADAGLPAEVGRLAVRLVGRVSGAERSSVNFRREQR